MEEFIMRTIFSALVGGILGGIVSFAFWKLKFQTQIKAGFYREVLEKLICPFYLWLLYGRIRAEDRRLTPNLPDEQRHMSIFYERNEDEQLIEVLKKHLHLAVADSRLFVQIEEFLRCREFNFDSIETRQRMYQIYQVMKEIYQDYSKKYKVLMGDY